MFAAADLRKAPVEFFADDALAEARTWLAIVMADSQRTCTASRKEAAVTRRTVTRHRRQSCCCSLPVQPLAPAIGRQAAQPPATPAAQRRDAGHQANAPATPAAKPAAPRRRPRQPPPIDGGWPRMYSLPSGGNVLVYQPQVASWDQQKHLVAFSAVSYRAKTGDKPTLGTIKLEVGHQACRSPIGWSASSS